MSERKIGLLEQVRVPETMQLGAAGEEAWIEVIQTMDSVYADLLHYQVELEEKNSALEEAQRFIRSVQSSMSDLLIVCDVNGRIERVNSALEQLTGRREIELLGRHFQTLFDEGSHDLVDGFSEKIRSESVYDCEVNLLTADGQLAPLAMNCTSRYDHDGRLVGMVLLGRPVGELRRAYEALNSAHNDLRQAQQHLVQAEKMASLGRLVAGVAHELNNPISFIFGNMHALKRYGDRLTRYLEAVHGGDSRDGLERLRGELKIDRITNDMGSLIDGTLEGAERVSSIVQDLRRFSANRREEREPFAFGAVARTAIDWVLKAERRDCELEIHCTGTAKAVGNKGSVHQIVVNLVQNALDVMESLERPRLEVACGGGEGRVWLSVRDHGPGIPDKALLKVFDPFYTTKAVGKGTGLGLYISYGLAAEQEGVLRAENHPAGGAVFTLELPSAS